MSAKTTLAPSSRKCRPMASPTPAAAPVTMAVRPAIEKDMATSGGCCGSRMDRMGAGRHGFRDGA